MINELFRHDACNHVKDKCPSFSQLDYNAQYFETCRGYKFHGLRNKGKTKVILGYMQTSYYKSCERCIIVNKEVL